jgi:hypothetical protein
MLIDYYIGYLAQSLDTAGNETEIYVDRITTILGETVQTSDFSALGRGILTINPKGDGLTSYPEIASFTGVSTTDVAFTGVTRGLDKNAVKQTSLQRYYPQGTPVIISITAQTISDLKSYIDAAVAGIIGTASDTAAGTVKLSQNLGTQARAQAVLVTQQASPGMTMQVKKFAIGDYVYTGGNTPTMTAPTSHARIDLVAYDKVLASIVVKQGSEAASPVVPQMSGDYIPLAYIYHVVGETNVKDVTDGTNGYVYLWCNPVLIPNAGSEKTMMGTSIETGYLAEDGSSFSSHSYPELARAVSGRFGYGVGVTSTANASTDVVTATSHGFVNGDIIFFANVGGALPGGISANTPYYVQSVTTNTFKIGTTASGSAVDITSAGTGTTTVYANLLLPDSRGTVTIGAGTKVNTATFDATSGGVNTSNEQITISSSAADWLITGQSVVLAAVGSGALPTGLSAGTYYVIKIDSTHIQLASTLANAQNGTAVDITAVGTGSATLTQTLTARNVGDTGGEEKHAMTSTELLSHNHHITSGTSGGTAATGVGVVNNQFDNSTVINATGGNTAMNNMQPYLVATKLIRY